MKKDATPADVQHMIERIETHGPKAARHRRHRADRDRRRRRRPQNAQGIAGKRGRAWPRCCRSWPLTKSPASKSSRSRRSSASAALPWGASMLGVIAGPCSVESEQQIVATAKAVKAAGATALRGGAFKPRTSPYSFQGLKDEGLEMLAAARDATGLAVVTEVMASEDRAAGGRSMPTCCRSAPATCRTIGCLEAVGELDRPVLLKRGPSATIDELLLGRRVHPQRRQLASHALRAGHPHLRGPHPLHAAAGHRPLSARQDASAGGGRSEPRHGA